MSAPGGRGTSTGKIWEQTIIPALESNYPGRYQKQAAVGEQLFGGRYIADILVDGNVVVSAKWQQVGGTAEQKILYDIASLIEVIRNSNGKYGKAYVVLGGTGFSPRAREFLLAQRHREYFQHSQLVEAVSLDDFIGRVNRRAL